MIEATLNYLHPPKASDSDGVLATLNRIAKELNAAERLDEVFTLILDEGSKLLGAESAQLAVVERRTGDLVLIRDTAGQADSNGHRFLERGKGICGWVAEHGGIAIVGDVHFDKRYFCTSKETRSELVVPLEVEDEVIGLLNFESTQINAFHQIPQDLLTSLAGYASAAIKRAQHLERVRGLQHIASAILDKRLDLGETLQVLLAKTVALLSPLNCQIALYDSEAEELRIVAASPKQAEGKRYSVHDCLAGRAVLQKTLIHIPDVRKEAEYQAAADQEGIVSEVAAPMMKADGTVLGVVNVENSYRFARSDVEFLDNLASLAALSIFNADLIEGYKRKKEELEVLRAIDEAIIDPELGLDQTFLIILEEVLEFLGCSDGGLWLWEDGRLLYKAQVGQETLDKRSLALGEGVCGTCAQQRKPILLDDVREFDAYIETLGNTRSELAYPLTQNGDLVGVFDAQSPTVGFFKPEHEEQLRGLAQHLVVAIRNAQLQDMRHRASKWDLVAQFNNEIRHWVVNKASPIYTTAEYLEETLAPSGASEETLTRLGRIKNGARKLLEVQQRFKSIVRELDPEPIDLASCLQEIVGLQVAGVSPPIKTHFDIAEALPKVLADAKQTEMVFENLIKNACEAMLGTEVRRLSITLTANQAQDRVRARISDTGCGIPPHDLENIFELFYTTKQEGSGFGLAISRETLRLMHGTISVQSVVNEGTIFEVWLPAIPEDEPPAAIPAPREALAS